MKTILCDLDRLNVSSVFSIILHNWKAHFNSNRCLENTPTPIRSVYLKASWLKMGRWRNITLQKIYKFLNGKMLPHDKFVVNWKLIIYNFTT